MKIIPWFEEILCNKFEISIHSLTEIKEIDNRGLELELLLKEHIEVLIKEIGTYKF